MIKTKKSTASITAVAVSVIVLIGGMLSAILLYGKKAY